MFVKRLASGVVLVILAVVLICLGGDILLAAMGIISVIGLFELYRVLKIEKTPLAAVGYAATVFYYVLLWLGRQDQVLFMAVPALMLLMGIYVFTFPKYKTDEIAGAFFGIFYVAVMLSYVWQVRTMTDGFYVAWLILIGSWGCDTCAYCVGMLIGRHKMTPLLSPKKSIEGAIGGVAGAAILGGIYGAVISGRMAGTGNPVSACAISCALAAVISQIGDLAASAIKRDHDVKDYGNLIPGHGGILDRFDSVLFTAPVIYFVMTFLR